MLRNFKTYQLSVQLFKECEKLKMKRVLKDQLTRASSSVVLNLAEGYGRNSQNDRKRFFEIAMGSLREVQGILDLSESSQLEAQADTVGAHLFKLIKKLE